jgi:hypothetical protein
MSRLDDVDIFDNPFRDPVYEEQGFIFDPERNQYYKIIEHPVYGSIRSYLSPRDQGEVPALSDARRAADDFSSEMAIRAELLKNRAREDAKRIDELRSKENLSGMERSLLEGLAKEMSERNRVPRGAISDEDYRKFTGINEIQSMNVGGAVNIDDENIFGTTMEMLRRENRPRAPEVTVEQPMFGMPREDMQSTQDFGGGARESMSISGTPGIDQVFTQILSSPGFRSMVRVEDVPPQNLQESKKIFEFLMKRDGIDRAVQYLVDTFGKATQFPIERSLGPDPRTQIVSGMEESMMSSQDPMDRGINALR